MVFWVPKLESGDDGALSLGARLVVSFSEAEHGGGNCRSLLLEKSELGAVRTAAILQAFDERRHAVLKLNLGGLAVDGFGIEVDHDEAGRRAKWQRELDKCSVFGFENRASLDADRNTAVLTKPGAVGALAIRERGLAKVGSLLACQLKLVPWATSRSAIPILFT